MFILIRIFLVFLAINYCAIARAEDVWRWVRVEPLSTPNPVSWEVLQGATKFNINDSEFIAELSYEEKGEYRHYRVTGKILRGKVEATETLLNSDAPLKNYEGFIEKIHGPGTEWAFDRIILTSGSSYLGLMRGLHLQADKQ